MILCLNNLLYTISAWPWAWRPIKRWVMIIVCCSKRPIEVSEITQEVFDYGTRYSQLVVHFLVISIGYVSYPPIVVIGFRNLIIGSLVDAFNFSCYGPTKAAPNLQRWAVLYILLGGLSCS
jgi:hypothetical protein